MRVVWPNTYRGRGSDISLEAAESVLDLCYPGSIQGPSRVGFSSVCQDEVFHKPRLMSWLGRAEMFFGSRGSLVRIQSPRP
jgi:hypothetical protein